jgi:peptidoglycan hydrolase-like protein with peptidoglycan-binding domain
LNKVGGYGLAEDGIFGEKTYEAVKAFQESQGVSIDGIVGEATWGALIKKTETSGAPAPAGAVNWQKIGLWSAVLIGGYMIAKRLGWQFGGYGDDERDDRR